MLTTDILIIGGGLAALKSAVSALSSGLQVTVAVKGRLCSGASFYPMMDMVACQASIGEPGADEQYLEEIMDASMGMADEEMNRVYIRDIRQRVREFPEIGVDRYRESDPKVACFATRARPTYVWSDWTRIRQNARAIFDAQSNARLLENTAVIALLTRAGTVNGAVLRRGEEREVIACRSIVLATGGFGDLFEHNLNTPDVSGDGQALALAAGASLINLEFLQFIPGFISPAYKTVFRETALPYADGLQTCDGRDLLEAYLPNPADRAECLRMRSAHGPFTCRTIAKYFDIAMMAEILRDPGPTRGFALRYRKEILQSKFTFIKPYVDWLREEKGVDITSQPIYIAPFYHAANGGVKIGRDTQTAVRGLFACGEASGGIHGADRLGGHSTGSCLVFGKIAGDNAARFAMGCQPLSIEPEQERDALMALYGGEGTLEPEPLLGQIRRLMWRAGGIIREEKPLAEAISQLCQWRENFAAMPWLDTTKAEQAVKAAHFLTLGQAVLTAMQNRRESRGSHYRADYPHLENAYAGRFEITQAEGGLCLREEKPCESA